MAAPSGESTGALAAAPSGVSTRVSMLKHNASRNLIGTSRSSLTAAAQTRPPAATPATQSDNDDDGFEYDESGFSDAAEKEVVLDPRNLPARAASFLTWLTCGLGGSGVGPSVRALVSRKKLRLVADGVDLDLSYITNRIIAMGYPSTGFEACYRNPAAAVAGFLEARHRFHYRIWNLCCERAYRSEGLFNAEVERFSWADHTPPPLSLVLPAAQSIDSWLGAHPENVAVVHCKAGKGRTGTMIAAYLVHCRTCRSADEAVEFFGWRRTQNGRGVTIPSQRRYVRYFALQQAAMQYCGGDGGGAASPVPSSLSAAAARGGVAGGVFLPAAAAAAAAALASPARSGDDRDRGGAFAVGAASRYRPATGVITRTEEQAPPVPAAPGDGATPVPVPPSLLLTLRVERDSERTPGFSLEPDARGRPVVAALKEVTSHASAPVSAGAEANSVVPVPLRALLRPGDELVAVNGADVSRRAFAEAVAALRAASDPLTLLLRRRPLPPAAASAASPAAAAAAVSPDPLPHGTAASGSTALATLPPLLPGPGPGLYLRRVAGGVGAWALASDTAAVPVPAVQLLGVYLSHVPRLRPAAARAGGGGCLQRRPWADPAAVHEDAAEVASGLYLRLFGGPGCTQLLWDSREAAAAAGTGATAPSVFHRGGTVTAGGGGSSSGSAASAAAGAGAALGDAHPPPLCAGLALAGGGGGGSSLPSSGSSSSPAGNSSSSSHLHLRLPSAAAASITGTASAGEPSSSSQQQQQAEARVGQATALLHDAAVGWEGRRFLPEEGGGRGALQLAGDFRLVVHSAGLRKPVAGCWLHTACLPLPLAAMRHVEGAMAARAGVPHATAAAAAASAGPLSPPAIAMRGEESGAAAAAAAAAAASGKSDRTSLLPTLLTSPTPTPAPTPAQLADAPAAAAAASPAAPTASSAAAGAKSVSPPHRSASSARGGGSGVGFTAQSSGAGSGAGAPEDGSVLPARGPVPSAAAAREVVARRLWLGPDVPGGVVGPAVPLLGALYTAAAAAVPPPPSQGVEAAARHASSSYAEGVAFFPKAVLDGAAKDKRHRVFPEDFVLTLRFRALQLPPEFWALDFAARHPPE